MNHRQLFLQYLAQTTEAPLLLEIEKAEDIYLFGPDGKRYIDLISGIGVSNVGHRHPKVIKAIQDQLNKYLHIMVYGEIIQSPQVLLAQRLAESLSYHLDNVYFVNSGSEAVEGALKLAKRFTGRREIVYFDKAYHGSTHGALSINGDEFYKQSYRPLLPDTRKINFNYIEDLKEISTATAAVIIEVVQGEAGVRKADESYLQSLKQRCLETGALLIFDEIQTGFGRTGKFWAFQHFGVIPDILVCAKGMGGGMPIGAFISSKEIMQTITFQPFLGHITTFGGHPVRCAASLAVIDILADDKIIDEVFLKESIFRQKLIHPKIKEVRSAGLMMAVQFDNYPHLKSIIDKAIQKGVLTDWFLHCNDSMRIAPPLTITVEQINEACVKILEAIDESLL